MRTINCIGDICPIPVIKARDAIREMTPPGSFRMIVDNEGAKENIEKLAFQEGAETESIQNEDGSFHIVVTVLDSPRPAPRAEVRSGKVVVISDDKLGHGERELGEILLQGFLFALTRQDTLPDAVLFYNRGVRLTTEDSPILPELRQLSEKGVRVLSCGSSLNYYNLTDQLMAGERTNLYEICTMMMQAEDVIKPC